MYDVHYQTIHHTHIIYMCVYIYKILSLKLWLIDSREVRGKRFLCSKPVDTNPLIQDNCLHCRLPSLVPPLSFLLSLSFSHGTWYQFQHHWSLPCLLRSLQVPSLAQTFRSLRHPFLFSMLSSVLPWHLLHKNLSQTMPHGWPFGIHHVLSCPLHFVHSRPLKSPVTNIVVMVMAVGDFVLSHFPRLWGATCQGQAARCRAR